MRVPSSGGIEEEEKKRISMMINYIPEIRI